MLFGKERSLEDQKIKKEFKKEYAIGIFILLFLFSIPLCTLFGMAPSSSSVMAGAEEVLENNGTWEEKQADAAAPEERTAETEDSLLVRIQDVLTDFTQNLVLRPLMIEGNTKLTAFLTGGTYMESTQVLLGKEQWLFYKTQNDGCPVYDYMGINHFSEEEMVVMADRLVSTRDYLEKEKGVSFLAVTIPNKEIVYEEYMPDTIARVNEVSRGGQFAEYMWTHTDVPYVYPLAAFGEVKEKYPLFYRTDTHWNHMGAFVGVQEILNTLYGYKQSLDEVRFTEGQKDFAGDLSVIGGIADRYAIDTVYEFDPASAAPACKREETLIVVGDSFGGFLSVIARGYYDEVYWVDTDDFTMSMVDEYGADVVIWETVERLQETFMQDDLMD